MSENTPTTSAAPAANSYAAFIPEIWSKKLSTMLEKKCVMLQCVNRNYEGEIAAQGDKVKIITPAQVAISTLGTSAITYDELEPTSQELVIDQQKFFAFKINDIAVRIGIFNTKRGETIDASLERSAIIIKYCAIKNGMLISNRPRIIRHSKNS